jgi:hypothetical protein
MKNHVIISSSECLAMIKVDIIVKDKGNVIYIYYCMFIVF